MQNRTNQVLVRKSHGPNQMEKNQNVAERETTAVGILIQPTHMIQWTKEWVDK